MTIFWYRRDLRIQDNAALYFALEENESVLPIFIFDTTILNQLDKNDARVSYIHSQLQCINKEFRAIGKSLAVFYGDPLEVFTKLITAHPIKKVYANHDYEPAARKRDLAINEILKSYHISFKTCKDQVLFEKSEIIKQDQTPYVVFTPYANKWKEKLSTLDIPYYPSEKKLHKLVAHEHPFLELIDIGFTPSPIAFPKINFSSTLINHYHETRNFPALANGTSLLSTSLRFGTISIRKLVKEASSYGNTAFLNELIWREFFMQIIWHFPHTIHKSFKEKYDTIPWENNETFFKKWCEGKTGYPFVDAGMRELNATGLMHNRVRMVVASFLCKHLLIDWRWGEVYFATKLLDYEQSSNVGNWQWAAGSGVDAAPYFRIFNPVEQVKKFDPQLQYIKKWIPELGTSLYPDPIVDHKMAREKCLTLYKNALQ